MSWVSRLSWIAAMTLTAGQANASIVPERVVTVRIYDYAAVSVSSLTAAKRTAAQVLDLAEVRLQFAECRTREDQPARDKSCELVPGPLDLFLHILDPGRAKASGTPRHCLGYAFLSDGFASTASVIFQRAIELEKSNRASRGAILGAMMAHEIGHLLLQLASHSSDGIMRAEWNAGDIQRLARGRMRFTSEEVSRLGLMVAKRQQALQSKKPID